MFLATLIVEYFVDDVVGDFVHNYQETLTTKLSETYSREKFYQSLWHVYFIIKRA